MSTVTTARTFPEYYAGKTWTVSQAENSLFDLEEQCQQVKNEIRKHEMEAQEKVRQHLVQQRKILCSEVDAYMEFKRREMSRLCSQGNRFQPEDRGNGYHRARYQSDCNLNPVAAKTRTAVSVEFDRVDLDSFKLDWMTLGKLNISERGDPSRMTTKSLDGEDDEDDEDPDCYINMSNQQKTNLQRQRAIDARRAHIGNASRSTDGQSSTAASSSKTSGVIAVGPGSRDNYENLWESGAGGMGRQSGPDQVGS